MPVIDFSWNIVRSGQNYYYYGTNPFFESTIVDVGYYYYIYDTKCDEKPIKLSTLGTTEKVNPIKGFQIVSNEFYQALTLYLKKSHSVKERILTRNVDG